MGAFRQRFSKSEAAEVPPAVGVAENLIERARTTWLEHMLIEALTKNDDQKGHIKAAFVKYRSYKLDEKVHVQAMVLSSAKAVLAKLA